MLQKYIKKFEVRNKDQATVENKLQKQQLQLNLDKSKLLKTLNTEVVERQVSVKNNPRVAA